MAADTAKDPLQLFIPDFTCSVVQRALKFSKAGVFNTKNVEFIHRLLICNAALPLNSPIASVRQTLT